MTSSHFLLYWTNHLYPKLFTLLVKLCKLSFLWTVGQTVRQTFYCVCGSYSVCMLNHVWLFCNPIDYSPPGSSVHGILQARILEWVAISFSRGSSRPRDQTQGSPDVSVDNLAHFLPYFNHDLPPGTGCSESYLYRNALPKDPLRQDSLDLPQSYLFHSSSANSNGDHFALKNYSRKCLQKVHITFCGHCVSPQNHMNLESSASCFSSGQLW